MLKLDLTSYELERLLPKGKNKKLIGLMKDELGKEVRIEFPQLSPKTYSYLTDDSDENKNAKDTKSVP